MKLEDTGPEHPQNIPLNSAPQTSRSALIWSHLILSHVPVVKGNETNTRKTRVKSAQHHKYVDM